MGEASLAQPGIAQHLRHLPDGCRRHARPVEAARRLLAAEIDDGGPDGGNGPILVRQLFLRNFQRSEEHTSELQSLMRISYAVFCLKKKTQSTDTEVYT